MHISSTKRISTPKSAGVTAFAFICVSILLIWGWSRQVIFAALEEAKTQPRFGLAGADTATLRVKIKELKETVGAIAALYPKAEDRRLIETAFHPIDFLESLPDLEETRRAFIKNPTLKNFLAYRRALDRTVARYQKDLERYQNALDNLPYVAKNEFYHYGTNAITREMLLSNISALIANAKTLNRRAIPSLSIAKASSAAVQNPVLTPDELRDIAFTQKIIERLKWLPVMPLAEIPTDCGVDPVKGERGLFYLARVNKFLTPLSIRQAFFHFTLSYGEETRFFKPLREAGLEYYWQPNFNYYSCPDVAYHAQIFTLYRVRELLLEWRASRWNIELPELTSAIDSFLKADPIWRETQDKMFNAMRSTLEKYPDEKLRELAGNDMPDLLREILEINREKSGYFEKLIRRGVAENRNLLKLTALLPQPLKIKELFITRSLPSLYFLPFNGSVWLDDAPLSFVRYYGQTKYYLDYQTLLKTYPEKTILDLIALSFGMAKQRSDP
ncbi:MAG: hypothetical protein UX07_C0014G0010 [Parcubacteria group bacterium GW2011_GWA2_45_30]|nr:MAG: hypothetical protein UX07_C0014G0010 [Parcubacteria group bacterium GW2011_GWA2_45_30]